MKITQQKLDKYFRSSIPTEYKIKGGSIAVITDNYFRALEIIEVLLLDYSDEDVVEVRTQGLRLIYVTLSSGDRLQWFSSNASFIGHQLKGIIFDGDVDYDDNFLDCVVRPISIYCTKDTVEVFNAFS